MRLPSKPADETARAAALKSYHILDTLPEQDYDSITRIASYICQMPVALITLVDEERTWIKSKSSEAFGISETPRDKAFCAHNILDPTSALVVEDARLDDRFSSNPVVVGDPGIVFYAGIPLVDPDGYALGSLCVVDHQARTLGEQQLQVLKDLARQVVNLLVLRKMNAALKGETDA